MHAHPTRPDRLQHTSTVVRCPRYGSPALIHLVERRCARAHLRSIIWCSLRDADQHCDECCLAAEMPADTARPESAEWPAAAR